jgi:hypothetical protein
VKYNGEKFTQGVPFSKRKGLVFIKNRMKLEFQISDSDSVRAICVHEAAHIFYFRQFGATDFIYHGPRMDYDRETGAYVVQCAAVEPKPYTKKPLTFEQQLELQARLAVSGSVASGAFAALSEGGKDDDFDNFERTCNQLNVNNHGPKFDAQALWDKAVPEVEADFKVLGNRAAIIAEAEKVRLSVFPWSTLPVVDSEDVQGENETSNQL